jgi:hypothetical protein
MIAAMLVYVALVVVMMLPIVWVLSEFQARVWLRLLLGGCTICASYGVFYIVGTFERLSYNSWYGIATRALIHAEIEAIEADRVVLVTAELKRLYEEFDPTYENRADYDRLAAEAAKRIAAGISNNSGLPSKGSNFIHPGAKPESDDRSNQTKPQ